MSLTITPFAQLPGEVLMDDRLKPTHIRVLIALYMHHNKKRDVIWPKRKTIARLTGIHEATISRLTTELEQFGWVTKEGNTGGCGRPAAYRVHVPDHITSAYDVQVDEDGEILGCKTVANSATVAESTTVADSTQNPSEIDYLTLAKSARGKEQTKNRQEQTNKESASAPTIPGVPEELTKEWKDVRKAKRAGPISQTVIEALHREAQKAGITVEQAVRCSVENGWQGFKASWYLKDHGQRAGAANLPNVPSKYAGAAAAIWGTPNQQQRGEVIDV